MNKLKRAGFLFLGLMLVASFAHAQSSGTIAGTVTDSTGAVIPNATVSAENTTTGVETTHATNTSGLFVLELTPGAYKVRVSATGFETVVHEKVTVEIGKRLFDAADPEWMQVSAFFYARGGIPIDTFWTGGELVSSVFVPPIDLVEYRGR